MSSATTDIVNRRLIELGIAPGLGVPVITPQAVSAGPAAGTILAIVTGLTNGSSVDFFPDDSRLAFSRTSPTSGNILSGLQPIGGGDLDSTLVEMLASAANSPRHTPFRMHVKPAALTISGTPPEATIGRPYRFDPIVSGGIPPYRIHAKGLDRATLSLTGKGVVAGVFRRPMTFLLIVEDSGGAKAEASVSIASGIGGDIPVIQLSGSVVLESASVGSTIGFLSVLASGLWTFVKTSDPDAKFAVNASTGEMTLAAPVDRATKASHSVSVAATNGVLTLTQSFTIAVAASPPVVVLPIGVVTGLLHGLPRAIPLAA